MDGRRLRAVARRFPGTRVTGCVLEPRDGARVRQCLQRLLAQLGAAEVALTGGLAIEYHLAAGARSAIRTSLNDLDLVCANTDALSPQLSRAFLVSHYHRRGPGVRKAMVQLVDASARLRIDIFPDVDGVVAAAALGSLGGTPVRILGAPTILKHKLRTLRKATAAAPADPKHWRDAVALAELCGCEVPARPAHLASAVFCRDIEASCSRCELSRTPDFPLAAKEQIFDILGYV